MSKRISARQYTPWLLSAMMAPVTQAASSCSWPVVLVIGVLCLGIAEEMTRFGVREVSSGWIGAIQWLWMLLVIAEFLHWVMYCWPVHGNYHVLPLTLLALAAGTVAGGREKASRAGGVLLWFLLFLFGLVLLSGLPEVKIRNLTPTWEIQTAYLIPVMLFPAMGLGIGETRKKRWILYGTIAVSMMTRGILGGTQIQRMEAPFYEMSRGLTLIGVGQRFESLVAAGMLLGYYVLLTFLLCITANAWAGERVHKKDIWITALFSGMIFVSGIRLNSRLLALGTIVIWVLFPVIKNFPKSAKSA